jgi:Asp-tRNA(Asn)/Glu-tRNA(Gln) amidotransferase A subunit family amidase
LLALAVRRVRFGTLQRTSLGADERRAVQLWRRARRRLSRAGIELRPATTPQEAAVRAQVAAAHELVAAYSAARWGGARLPAERARALLRELDQALSRV